MKDIYDILREWKKRREEQFALATIVRAEGSSYRRRERGRDLPIPPDKLI